MYVLLERSLQWMPVTQSAGMGAVTNLAIVGLDDAKFEGRLRRARVPEWRWNEIEDWVRVMLNEYMLWHEKRSTVGFDEKDLKLFDEVEVG